MRISRIGVFLALTALAASYPPQASGYDLDLRSTTYLHLYQEDQAAGPDIDHAPLYEYLSLDLWEIGRPELSFHLYGWGRTELGDETAEDTRDGHLSSAQIRYHGSDFSVRAGRMLLTEGTTMESLDGLHIRKALGSTGFSLYGGAPEGGDGSDGLRGDTLAGVRAFFTSPGKVEIGLSYLHEDGDFGGEEREEAGTDLWLKPTGALMITGHALYNLSTSGLASDDISLMLSLSPRLDFTLATEGYAYGDLLQAVTNPAFHTSGISMDDKVRIMKSGFSWRALNRLDIRGAVKRTDHKEADPGDNIRTEIGFDVDTSILLDRIGVRLADQSGDLPENEYREMRIYCMAAAGPISWSLDALALMYEEQINGEDQTTQLTGSAGWKLSKNFGVTGNVRLTRSPVYDEDLAVVLKARYDIGAGSGAYR